MGMYKTVLLSKNNHLVSALGYIDTGNFLKDQKTNRPVAIASPDLMIELMPKSYHPIIYSYINEALSFTDCDVNCEHIGLHLIPYSTICSKCELMIAFDCDFLFVDKKIIQNKPLIGISKENFTLLNTNMCILLNRKFMKRGIRKW